MKKFIFSLILAATFFTLEGSFNFVNAKDLDNGLYATFKTNKGDIVCKLFEDQVPKTVENFVGLATGAKEYFDSKTGEQKRGNFYDGLIFHRVIANFMVQGGCPLGKGIGGPGYKFKDEFSPDLKHNEPGILSMANSGPNTNGSQFFLTVVPTPWLDNRHSIFGKVVEGLDVLMAISKVPTDSRDKPLEAILIKTLEIKRVGEEK